MNLQFTRTIWDQTPISIHQLHICTIKTMARTKQTSDRIHSKSLKSKKTEKKKRQKHVVVVDGEKKEKRRHHRFRPGTVALRDIRKAQGSTKKMFHRAPFGRLVRCISDQVRCVRWKKDALETLQEGTEAYMVRMFQKVMEVTIGRKGVQLLPQDMHVLAAVMEDMDPIMMDAWREIEKAKRKGTTISDFPISPTDAVL